LISSNAGSTKRSAHRAKQLQVEVGVDTDERRIDVRVQQAAVDLDTAIRNETDRVCGAH
jgi:hypothetical protein